MLRLPVPAWYLVVTALAGSQRLRELAISARNEAGTKGRRAAARTYPLMIAAHVGLFTLPPVEISVRQRRPALGGALPWLGVLAAATGLRWWSIASLGRAWNVRALVATDLRPVARGPYRWVRHPNYVAVVLEFLALPMAGGAPASAVGLSLLNGLLLADRIREEERLLEATPGYSELFSGRARFIPGLV